MNSIFLIQNNKDPKSALSKMSGRKPYCWISFILKMENNIIPKLGKEIKPIMALLSCI